MRRTYTLFQSSFSKLIEYAAKPPSTNQPAWTRIAYKLVEGPSIGGEVSSPDQKHLDGIRKGYDIEDSIGKLELELMEEIAGALGKTGDKCVYYFRELKRAKAAFDACPSPSSFTASSSSSSFSSALIQRRTAANEFNSIRRLAEDARRDLIIHRQACGFTSNNFKIVDEVFPLPPPILVTSGHRLQELKNMKLYKMQQLDKGTIKKELLSLGITHSYRDCSDSNNDNEEKSSNPSKDVLSSSSSLSKQVSISIDIMQKNELLLLLRTSLQLHS